MLTETQDAAGGTEDQSQCAGSIGIDGGHAEKQQGRKGNQGSSAGDRINGPAGLPLPKQGQWLLWTTSILATLKVRVSSL